MSRAHRDKGIIKKQGPLRHLSRQRDKWRCQGCQAVSCPRGQECYYWSRFQRRMREFYGGIEKEETPQEFLQWKEEFCGGGIRCVLRMHHKVQLSHGGQDRMNNVVTLCERCESKIIHDSNVSFKSNVTSKSNVTHNKEGLSHGNMSTQKREGTV